MEKGLPRGRYWVVVKKDDVKEVQRLLKALRLINRRLRKQISTANAKHLVVSARLENSTSTIPEMKAQNMLAWNSHMLASAKCSIFHLIEDVESSLDMTASCNCGPVIQADIDIDVDSSDQ